MNIYDNLELLIEELNKSGVCKDDIKLLETRYPGLVTDEIPINGFTDIKTTLFLKQVIEIISKKNEELKESIINVDLPMLVEEINKTQLVYEGFKSAFEDIDTKLQEDIYLNKFLIGHYVEVEGEVPVLLDYGDFDVLDILLYKNNGIEHLDNYREALPLITKLKTLKDETDVNFIKFLNASEVISFKQFIGQLQFIVVEKFNNCIKISTSAIEELSEGKTSVNIKEHFENIQILLKESNILILDICLKLLKKN